MERFGERPVAIYRLFENAAFGPEEIRSLSEAYESTLLALGLVDRNDPVTELIAKKIIEVAQTGERDAQRLSALAIEQLGIPAVIPSKAM
jgi:hypothetical protein